MNQRNICFQYEDYVYDTEPNVFYRGPKKIQFSGNTLAVAEGEAERQR